MKVDIPYATGSKVMKILLQLAIFSNFCFADSETLQNLGIILTNSTKHTLYVDSDQTTLLNIEFTPHLANFSRKNIVCYENKNDINVQAQNIFNTLLAEWIGLKANVSLINPGSFHEKHHKLLLPLIHQEVKINKVYGTWNYGHTKQQTPNLEEVLDNNPKTYTSFNDNCALETRWNQFSFRVMSESRVEHVVMQVSKGSPEYFKLDVTFNDVNASEFKLLAPDVINWNKLDIKDSQHSYVIANIAEAYNKTMVKLLKNNPSYEYTHEKDPLKEFVIDLRWTNNVFEKWRIGGQHRSMDAECVRFKCFEIIAFTNRTIEDVASELERNINGSWSKPAKDVPVITKDNPSTPRLSRRKALRLSFSADSRRKLEHLDDVPISYKTHRETTRAQTTPFPRVEIETTSLVDLTTSIGANLYGESSSDSSSYDEYSSEVDICRGDNCRYRRQVIPLIIAASGMIAGISAGAAIVHHSDNNSKQIKADELLTAKLVDITSKDLEKLQIQITNENRAVDNALRRECETTDQLSQQMFLEQIIDEFDEFKDRLTQEILNLKTRASFRNNRALETVINACTLLNGRNRETACRDFIEITPVKVIEYVPKMDKGHKLSIIIKVEFANPQMEELSQTFNVLSVAVPIGIRNEKYFYLKLITPKLIAYSDKVNKAFSVDNCKTNFLMKSIFCSDKDLFYDKSMDLCASSLVTNEKSKACEHEMIHSKMDCLFSSNKDYVLVAHFHTPNAQSSQTTSIIPVTKVGSQELDHKSNVTVFERIDHTLTITCHSASYSVKGKSREVNEIVDINLENLSPNTFHISDNHFDNILSQLNKTEMINKTDLQEISKEFQYGYKTGNKRVDEMISGVRPFSHIALWVLVLITVGVILLSVFVYSFIATNEILKCLCPALYKRRRRTTVHESTVIQDRLSQEGTMLRELPSHRQAPQVPERRINHSNFRRDQRPQSSRSLQIEERL